MNLRAIFFIPRRDIPAGPYCKQGIAIAEECGIFKADKACPFFSILSMKTIAVILLMGCCLYVPAQKAFTVFGYYAGSATMIDSFPVEKLTHLCFSFTHLKGNRISLSTARDTAGLRNCVVQKRRNPKLKVLLSFGGWTGCYSCSDVFATDSSRKQFAGSVKKMLTDFTADGIDMDWEYPAIPGPPGHPYSPNDKYHFTALMQDLRDSIGKEKELSFAAGGFDNYINNAVEWDKVTKLVNRINIMSYDMITGYDTITGHHTGLYSNPSQSLSCDKAIKLLRAKGVPANKLVIGAAFYARIWEKVTAENYGLYQRGKFLRSVSYKNFRSTLSTDSGFVFHWDAVASAPYLYHPEKKWFVTFDDSTSISLKTLYAVKHKLNGIMYWQMVDDAFQEGLLNVIDETRKKYKH